MISNEIHAWGELVFANMTYSLMLQVLQNDFTPSGVMIYLIEREIWLGPEKFCLIRYIIKLCKYFRRTKVTKFPQVGAENVGIFSQYKR